MRKKLLQIFLAILYLLNLVIKQLDIIKTYSKSLLTDNNLLIFIKILVENFRFIEKELVAWLLRSIHDFTQFDRLWNQKKIVFSKNLGFKIFNTDLSYFIR